MGRLRSARRFLIFIVLWAVILKLIYGEVYRPEETLAQYHTNVFGVLNLWRAILPHMRARKAGIIATVGSMGASKFDPLIGIYHSSKAAIRSKYSLVLI